MRKDKSGCRWYLGIVVVIMGLMSFLCVFAAYGLGNYECIKCCSCCNFNTCLEVKMCLQMLSILTGVICLSYLASLLIKKMPDLDKESEREYRWETRKSGQ